MAGSAAGSAIRAGCALLVIKHSAWYVFWKKMKYLLPSEERSTPIFLRPVLIKICLDPGMCLMLEPKLLELLNVIESPFYLVASCCINTISYPILSCR